MNKAEILAEARRLFRMGSDTETLLSFLRQQGFGKIDSIVALRDITGQHLTMAKEAVHRSAAWADRFQSDERLHEELWHAAEATGDFDVKSSGEDGNKND